MKKFLLNLLFVAIVSPSRLRTLSEIQLLDDPTATNALPKTTNSTSNDNPNLKTDVSGDKKDK